MKIFSIFLVFFTFGLSAEEHGSHIDHNHHNQAHQHAPIGVMGSHLHEEGSWMFSYRFMYMDMDGLRKGTDRVSRSDANGPMMAGKYPMVPRQMTMKMHMLGTMYGVTDDLTMSLMIPWLEKSMDSSARMMGGTGPENKFSTRSDGFGDIKLGSLYRLYKNDDLEVIFNLGLSLPTGSYEEQGKNPMSMGNELRQGYPMQLGSGTFDLMPGITIAGHTDTLGYGAQVIGTIPLGRNSQGYSQGDSIKFNTWLSRKITRNFSLSGRIELNSWNDYNGHDDELVGRVNMMPTADHDLRGGTRADAYIGGNYLFTEGALKGHNLGLEFGMPFYQQLEGPNLETDYILTVGWRVSF
ncbi:MAG: transporter [Lentisphaeraceae bacterium]|nr:transporter [Lentisphaeraceae bacterium]